MPKPLLQGRWEKLLRSSLEQVSYSTVPYRIKTVFCSKRETSRDWENNAVCVDLYVDSYQARHAAQKGAHKTKTAKHKKQMTVRVVGLVPIPGDGDGILVVFPSPGVRPMSLFGPPISDHRPSTHRPLDRQLDNNFHHDHDDADAHESDDNNDASMHPVPTAPA